MRLMEMLRIPAAELERNTGIPIHFAENTDALHRYLARHMADTVVDNNRQG